MKTPAIFALMLAASGAAYAAGDPAGGTFSLADAEKGLTGKGDLTATIETSHGTITCVLFRDDAPNTVANFVGLARGLRPFQDVRSGEWVKRPFYDGLGFHRVMRKFMIQGGDPKNNGTGGPGYSIKDEKNGLNKFDKGGVLAMANRGPDTASSQFFITEKDTAFLDDGARPGAHYQIFGQCQNLDVVKKITALQGPGDRPTEPVTITKIAIARAAK